MPPWSRSQPDPLKTRRRQLAEQERALAERMARLQRELQDGQSPTILEKKVTQPPVWRTEEEGQDQTWRRTSAPRGLGRQRQRDKVIFFICCAILLGMLGIVAWLWKHAGG